MQIENIKKILVDAGNGLVRQLHDLVFSRLTTAKIAAIAAGLKLFAGRIVYNTTTGFYQKYNGTAWINLERPYKVYSALLTQAAGAAPAATVLENSVGTIVWARTSAGLYTGTLVGAFTASKTILLLNGAALAGGSVTIVRTSADVVTITTKDATPAVADSLLNGASLLIQVYP